MELIQNVFNTILGLGSHVFLPLVIIMLGLVVKLSLKEAFSAGLTLGVAFVGMNTIMNFMFGFISPAAEAITTNTGLQLTAIDVGWSPVSSIAWAWPYAILLFPIQIIINVIMLAIGKTSTLNVDMWNVWNKVLTAVFVYYFSNNIIFALAIGALQVVFELIMADVTQPQTYRVSHVPGVSFPHSMALLNIIMNPLNELLEKIPFFRKELDADALRDRIGIFAENHVMGFIVGLVLGFAAGYEWTAVLNLAVSLATALVLFPMVAKLFMQALAPLSEAAGEFMRARFPDREFYIGLDWPFMAGSSEVWVTMIILVPIILVTAAILPGNTILPAGGIINVCAGAPLLVLTGGHILRMIVLGAISTPLFLYAGTYFADPITDLARSTGTYELGAGQTISWGTMESPGFRMVVAELGKIFEGGFLGIALFVGWIALFVYFVRTFKKRNEKFAAEDAAAEAN